MVDLALVTSFPRMESATSSIVKVYKDLLLRCPRVTTVVMEHISCSSYSAIKDILSENSSSHVLNIYAFLQLRQRNADNPPDAANLCNCISVGRIKNLGTQHFSSNGRPGLGRDLDFGIPREEVVIPAVLIWVVRGKSVRNLV